MRPFLRRPYQSLAASASASASSLSLSSASASVSVSVSSTTSTLEAAHNDRPGNGRHVGRDRPSRRGVCFRFVPCRLLLFASRSPSVAIVLAVVAAVVVVVAVVVVNVSVISVVGPAAATATPAAAATVTTSAFASTEENLGLGRSVGGTSTTRSERSQGQGQGRIRHFFPPPGTHDFDRVCGWVQSHDFAGPPPRRYRHDRDDNDDDDDDDDDDYNDNYCTLLVRQTPTSNEGLAHWSSEVTAGFLYAIQTGCRLLVDYSPPSPLHNSNYNDNATSSAHNGKTTRGGGGEGEVGEDGGERVDLSQVLLPAKLVRRSSFDWSPGVQHEHDDDDDEDNEETEDGDDGGDGQAQRQQQQRRRRRRTWSNWTVPPDFVCDENGATTTERCVQVNDNWGRTITMIEGESNRKLNPAVARHMDLMARKLGLVPAEHHNGNGSDNYDNSNNNDNDDDGKKSDQISTAILPVPRYRYASSSGPYRDLIKSMPPGFKPKYGMACAFASMFRLALEPASPSISWWSSSSSSSLDRYVPRLRTEILPAVHDPEALVISIYLRTGRTDDMAHIESERRGWGAGWGMKRGKMVVSVPAKKEMKKLIKTKEKANDTILRREEGEGLRGGGENGEREERLMERLVDGKSRRTAKRSNENVSGEKGRRQSRRRLREKGTAVTTMTTTTITTKNVIMTTPAVEEMKKLGRAQEGVVQCALQAERDLIALRLRILSSQSSSSSSSSEPNATSAVINMYKRVVWTVVGDSPGMAKTVATRYGGGRVAILDNGREGMDANANANTNSKNFTNTNTATITMSTMTTTYIPRTVLTTETDGTHVRPLRRPSTHDFAQAYVDWYLLGEADALVLGSMGYSFGRTANLRTGFKPLYSASGKGYECGRVEWDEEGAGVRS